MASGRAIGRRLLLLVVVVLVGALMVADILPNPFPAVWAWVNEERPLADEVSWQERLGSRPENAAFAGDMVALFDGSRAQLREPGTGTLVGPSEPAGWSADWLVAAGTGSDAVVITSGEDGGYEIREPATGRVIGQDEEAVAAWGFRDAWLALRCDRQRACQLRGFEPGEPEPAWQTDLPGQRSGMLGGDPELAAPRPAGSGRIGSGALIPEPAPSALGFPVTRRGDDVVVVVDTRTGAIRQEVTEQDGERVLVAGGRVLRSQLARYDGVCVSEVTAYDAATGDPVWGPEAYHLWGTGDVGCEQRVPPLASGAAVTARAPDGRPLVLDAYDGRVLWRGEQEEQVESLSPELAVVRGADGTTVYGVRLGGGDQLWERRADQDAELAVAHCGVVVSDRHPSRVYVWDPGSGEDLLSLSSSARVLACTDEGLLLAGGRSVAFAPFGGVSEAPERAGHSDSK